MSTVLPSEAGRPPNAARYVPVVGPRLRILLWAVFAIVAMLGANSLYMASVTVLNWWTGRNYENWFSLWMALAHVALGLLLVVPFLTFGVAHLCTARKRKNKRAIRVGYGLFAFSLTVLISGFLLMRLDFGGSGAQSTTLVINDPATRAAIYWAHVIAPLACLWLYWLHRLVGQRIRWRLGLGYLTAVVVLVGCLIVVHNQDPRKWNQVGSKDGDQYFFPSLSKTSDGKFIPAHVLDNNEYCLKCHQDAYEGWFHSAHHFSSFNNPAYLASVRETREVLLKADGNVNGARFCAGCHDPVPFFSGAFDDPKFDDVNHPTAQAGITCTACHAITHVNSTRGNADFTIEEPQHYPFAASDNPVLQWINNQLIKAKPAFHKQTFLKDFHKSAEFCSTCHKVHLPYQLNKYKEFLRGQDHYNTYLLSGVSGHGARSFYYPEKAQQNCNGCHMPLKPSQDFGAKLFAETKQPSIHSHLFPSANTAIAWLNNSPETIAAHQDFLKGVMRVDIFGLKEGGAVDGKLHAPLRPELPAVQPGATYLLETVIRTLKLGHPFTQGTADSNEVWLDVTVASGDRIIGRSGGIDETSEVDPWSHFVNLFVIDRHGNRIDRRNPQDIFVPLYNHQIPPGAGQTVHYELQVPDDITKPISIEVKLQYRKFDKSYTDYFTAKAKPGDLPIRGHTPGEPYRNELPITTLAMDRVVLPVAGRSAPVENAPVQIPTWQRWNDYGIGLLLKGQGRAEPRQAEEAFQQVEQLNRYDGPLNLARTYHAEGRLDDAVAALARAAAFTDPPAPAWTLAWLSGLVNREQGRLADAERNFRSVLYDQTTERQARGFDFSQDYEVINLLGLTLFDRARQLRDPARRQERESQLREAVAKFHETLNIDSEDITAHYQLSLIYKELGNAEKSAKHHKLHGRYKLDDNARDLAIGLARKKYPAANHAAEAVVIYPLTRSGAPGLPAGGEPDVSLRTIEDRP